MCSATGSAGQSWNRRRMWHTLQFPMHKSHALSMGETGRGCSVGKLTRRLPGGSIGAFYDVSTGEEGAPVVGRCPGES